MFTHICLSLKSSKHNNGFYTLNDVTLRNARLNAPLGGAIGGAVLSRNRLIGSSACGALATFKPSFRTRYVRKAAVCRNDVTSHTTLDDASTAALLPLQPVRWASNVAQSEQSHNHIGCSKNSLNSQLLKSSFNSDSSQNLN